MRNKLVKIRYYGIVALMVVFMLQIKPVQKTYKQYIVPAVVMFLSDVMNGTIEYTSYNILFKMS